MSRLVGTVKLIREIRVGPAIEGSNFEAFYGHRRYQGRTEAEALANLLHDLPKGHYDVNLGDDWPSVRAAMRIQA